MRETGNISQFLQLQCHCETWWNEFHFGVLKWRTTGSSEGTDRAGEVEVYVRKKFNSTVLTVIHEVVEILRVRIRGMENKGDDGVGA